MGLLRRWLGRLGASTDEITWEDRRRMAAQDGADALASASDRQYVVIRGTVETLTIRPRETTNWLEARVGDGTGTVTLIWMGRHEIPGIEAGREMRVEGRISTVDGQRRIYNPLYTLL